MSGSINRWTASFLGAVCFSFLSLPIGCTSNESKAIVTLERAGARLGVDDAGHVWSVHLNGRNVTAEQAAAIRSLPGLVYLNLSDCDLSPNVIPAISRSHELRKLYLSGSELGTSSVGPLAGLRELRVLELSDTGVPLQSISGLSILPELEFLGLTHLRPTPSEREQVEQLFSTGCQLRFGAASVKAESSAHEKRPE